MLSNIYCDPCFLLIAYSSLKNKQVANVITIFIENFTLSSIISLSEQLKSKKYAPNSTKKIFTPKTSKIIKPLSIFSSKDVIIQEALKLLLEPFFENIFLDSSHGFRKDRSCHSALKSIYYKWRGVKWFIEFYLIQHCNMIYRQGFINSLNEFINDYSICNLINRFLKKGCIQFTHLCDSTLVLNRSTLQDSLLSPVICNIFLHELDVFVKNYDSRKTHKKYENVLKKFVWNHI